MKNKEKILKRENNETATEMANNNKAK